VVNILLAFIFACTFPFVALCQELPQELVNQIVIPRSSELSAFKQGSGIVSGDFELTFKVPISWPASETIKEITSGTEKKGWTVRERKSDHLSFLSPNLWDWRKYKDFGLGIDVRSWRKEWEKPTGEILIYFLMYKENDLNELEVHCIYMTSETVRNIEELEKKK
jgi:hypothetical protein